MVRLDYFSNKRQKLFPTLPKLSHRKAFQKILNTEGLKTREREKETQTTNTKTNHD